MGFLNLYKKTQHPQSLKLLLQPQKLPDPPESQPEAQAAPPQKHLHVLAFCYPLPWVSALHPQLQWAFGLTALQFDPGQLRFVLVYSMLSRCPMDCSPCADPNQTVVSLENKLFLNGALSCFLFLDSGLFQINLAVSSY